MKMNRSLAIASLFAVSFARCGAATLTEDFATDPLQGGWQVFGNASLFRWDSTNQNLAVTWDSSQPNSYFYRPLGTILARDDDFSIAFDWQLNLVETGGYGFEIALGFLNVAQATQPDFSRGTGTNSPNLAELDYFPAPGNGTISPTMISTSNEFAAAFDYPLNLSTGVWYHVVMAYTASNQTLSTSITYSNGQIFGPIDAVSLSDYGTNFSDFRLNAFAISSYNGAGDPYDTTYAQGIVDNLVITVPPPPIQHFTGYLTNAVWQAQFLSRSNWLYTLERTTEFRTWAAVSPTTAGTATILLLQDANAPQNEAFYRLKAERP